MASNPPPSDEDASQLQVEEETMHGSSGQRSFMRSSRSLFNLSSLFRSSSSSDRKKTIPKDFQDPNQAIRRKPAPSPSRAPPNPPTGSELASYGSQQSSPTSYPYSPEDYQQSGSSTPQYQSPADQSPRHFQSPHDGQSELPVRGRQGWNENFARSQPPGPPTNTMGTVQSAQMGNHGSLAHVQSHMNTMGPPPAPLSHPPPQSSHRPGPSHLTKAPPHKLAAPIHQQHQHQQLNQYNQQPHPSPRSSSQPSPMEGNRLHKATPSLQPSHLSPTSNSPGGSPGASPVMRGRDRSSSLLPPSEYQMGGSNRVVSSPGNASRSPGGAAYNSDSGGSADGRDKRRSWAFGGRSRASSKGEADKDSQAAWVCSPNGKVAYNAQLLLNGDKVPELWTEHADTYVYLFPGKGPSFKIPSVAISSSGQLMAMAFGPGRPRARSFDGRQSLSVEDARHINLRNLNTPPATPRTSKDNTSDGSGESVSSLALGDSSKEGHIFFPFTSNSAAQGSDATTQFGLHRLVSVRNLFAFLTGQPLVATRENSNPFKIFCDISCHLNRFGFANLDGSTYGEAATACFNFYVADLMLAEISGSREKTIQAVILGERMRSTSLYNEGFSHAVGKYASTRKLDLNVWNLLSENTRVRLERGDTELQRRKKLIQIRLTDCEFPSLWAGIAASTTSDESKAVNFKAWKSSFFSMRKFFLNFYRFQLGNWPPKASSKKNAFSESGFNRLVLRILYTDLCDLYDLLVDRQNPTTRSLATAEIPEATERTMCVTTLRKMLGEYDRSEPPVQPPVPFDAPLIPEITTIDASHGRHSSQVQSDANNRKLKEHEITLLLTKAKNLDSQKPTEFLRSFGDFEAKEARGCTAQELSDKRIGQWLFMYAVLEALPMLVVDAPDCRDTGSVEYFLCLRAQGSPPWVEEVIQMAYYRTDDGSTVAMPADRIANSPEGIYMRSHCWLMADIWAQQIQSSDEESSASIERQQFQGIDDMMSPLDAPAPPFAAEAGDHRPRSTGHDGHAREPETGSLLSPQKPENRSRSRSADNKRRSLVFGLQELPMSHGMTHVHASPPVGTAGAGSYMSAGAGMRDISPGGGTARTPESGNGSPGATFDDILKDVESEKDRKRKNRKSFFGSGK